MVGDHIRQSASLALFVPHENYAHHPPEELGYLFAKILSSVLSFHNDSVIFTEKPRIRLLISNTCGSRAP